jgi:hypothetical protein
MAPGRKWAPALVHLKECASARASPRPASAAPAPCLGYNVKQEAPGKSALPLMQLSRSVRGADCLMSACCALRALVGVGPWREDGYVCAPQSV